MHKAFASLFILLVLLGCNSSSGDVYMKSINGKWDKKAEQKIDFEIKDAQNPKNIIFVVRNNNDFPYSNIRFIANFKDLKTNAVKVDTLNYVLANPNGEWVGNGFGDTKETLFQYKLNYKFPQNGKYEIGVIQAMRNDFLPGVEDIGIRIESAKP